MRQNPAGLSRDDWTELAAQLIYRGRLTREEIARSLGVSLFTLYRRAKEDPFKARVKAIADAHWAETKRELRSEVAGRGGCQTGQESISGLRYF